MNKILTEISNIVRDGLRTYLPKVDTKDLEESGTIYYMNGRDGTAFDWFVNNHLCPLMCFYDDEANMGAVKVLLYKDGTLDCFYYENQKNDPFKEITRHLSCSEDEIKELAVMLYKTEKNENLFGKSLDSYDTDTPIFDVDIEDFDKNEQSCNFFTARRNFYSQLCLVSRKITDEGYKIGFMIKDEPAQESDSGWYFAAGNETDEYAQNANNTQVLPMGQLLNIAPEVEEFVSNPVGSAFIKVEPGKFIKDDGVSEIYVEQE